MTREVCWKVKNIQHIGSDIDYDGSNFHQAKCYFILQMNYVKDLSSIPYVKQEYKFKNSLWQESHVERLNIQQIGSDIDYDGSIFHQAKCYFILQMNYVKDLSSIPYCAAQQKQTNIK